MDRSKLEENIIYLLNKYLPARKDLFDLIKTDIDSVKYILSEIDKFKKEDYEKKDIDLIKEIALFYL